MDNLWQFVFAKYMDCRLDLFQLDALFLNWSNTVSR